MTESEVVVRIEKDTESVILAFTHSFKITDSGGVWNAWQGKFFEVNHSYLCENTREITPEDMKNPNSCQIIMNQVFEFQKENKTKVKILFPFIERS